MRRTACIAAVGTVLGLACGNHESGARATAAPTFSPEPGSYASPQVVALSCATPLATIYYTTDGSVPDINSTVYTGPITVSSATTVIAFAVASGLGPSALATGVYAIELPNRTATPAFSPPPGTYGSPQLVTLSCAMPGATIYYTTDGSLPGVFSNVYTGPIAVSSTTTIRAVALASGSNVSELASGTYVVQMPNRTATPTFAPPPGAYGVIQSVTLSCATAGSTIYYTVDGSVPSTSSAIYVGPILVSSTTTIRAVARAINRAVSEIAVGAYAVDLENRTAAPVFSPAQGRYGSAQVVKISCATPGATVHYTTDGSVPTQASAVWGPGDWGIILMSSATFRAVAWTNGMNASELVTATYTIDLPNRTATPTFSPPPGTYPSPQTVTLACSTPGAAINYEADGGALPDLYSPVYTAPIAVSSTTTITANAWVNGMSPSQFAIGTYVIEGTGSCTAGATRSCFTGPFSTRNVGLCHDGTQACNEDGHWGACLGQQLPTAEVCNGDDDDCNGFRDDGFFGVRDGNPVCVETLVANDPLPADAGAQNVRLSDYGERWFSQRFTETDGLSNDLTGTIVLYAPYGCAFELFVYCAACGGAFLGSSAEYFPTVHVHAEDHEGVDDSFTVVIEVRYRSCPPGPELVCGDWSMEITGNTSVPIGAAACN